MRRFISTGSACSAKLAEGSVRGAAAKKIGWLGRALPGSPFTPGRKRSGVFLSPRRTTGKMFPTPHCATFAFRWSLYLAFAKMRKGNGRTQVFSSTRGEPTPVRHSEGDSDAKVPTPFLRIRGRRRIGFRDASDRLPPLASSATASAGRQTGRSRSRRTPGTQFRSTSRSPLTARCLDGFFQRAVGVQPTVSFTVCSGGQTCASVSRRRLMSRSGESPKRLL